MKTTHKNICDKIESSLRDNLLFSRLDPTQLNEMCKNSKLIELDEGEVLFNQGDAVHSFFYVDRGVIKLFRQSPDGQEKIFELEGQGQTFAEALMFMSAERYPVSASALRKSRVIAINTRTFLGILKQSTDISLSIMGDLSHRLHDLINEIDHLSLQSGRNRVATYFLDQALNRGMEFVLEIPKNAIASMLSLQPETFSRMIKELRTQQILEVHDQAIRVLDLTKLRQFAGII